MINPDDPYSIIPRGASAGKVKSFDFQIRTLVEYDANYLRDRVVSNVFVNGKPCGVYAATADENYDGLPPERLIEIHGPNLERVVVDEFMGLGYRKRVRDLEDRLQILADHINRVRWWQVRRRWIAWREA